MLRQLLASQATLYMLAWARPLGMSELHDLIQLALQRLQDSDMPPESLLATNLWQVFDYMRSKRFKAAQRAVRNCQACIVLDLY